MCGALKGELGNKKLEAGWIQGTKDLTMIVVLWLIVTYLILEFFSYMKGGKDHLPF